MPEMKQYLYRVEPSGREILATDPEPGVVQTLEQHVAYVRDLTQKGVLVLAGRTLNEDDTTFGIVIFQAESDSEASEVMDQDPAVKAGLMKAGLFPFRVAFANTTRCSM